MNLKPCIPFPMHARQSGTSGTEPSLQNGGQMSSESPLRFFLQLLELARYDLH